MAQAFAYIRTSARPGKSRQRLLSNNYDDKDESDDDDKEENLVDTCILQQDGV